MPATDSARSTQTVTRSARLAPGGSTSCLSASRGGTPRISRSGERAKISDVQVPAAAPAKIGSSATRGVTSTGMTSASNEGSANWIATPTSTPIRDPIPPSNTA